LFTAGVSHRQPAFGFILAIVFLDALSFGLIFPVLPKLVLSLASGDTGYAARAFGLMAAAWSLMNFVGSPVLGALSDRFGRRPVILISAFGLAFDFLVMALAPSLAWLFVGRILSGLTSATYAAAAAFLADVTPVENRSQRFGMFSAVYGAGIILGPAFGGMLAGLSLRAPFYAAAALTALGWIYGFLVLPESLPRELRAKTAWRAANPVHSFGLLAKDSSLLGLAGLGSWSSSRTKRPALLRFSTLDIAIIGRRFRLVCSWLRSVLATSW
jgi:DHA1 family tetracycline resistance protein-like MFS transporter